MDIRSIKISSIKPSSLILVLFVVLIFGLYPLRVLALSDEDIDSILRGTVWHKTDDGKVSCSSTVTGGGVIDQFLQATAILESSNNITAENPNPLSGASGKYQYIPSTWRGLAEQVYPPALQFQTAAQAPEEIQDAVAYLDKARYLRDSPDVDLATLAAIHYIGHIPVNDEEWNSVPRPDAGNILTVRQYAQSIIDKVESGAGKNVTLRYVDAPDFQAALAQLGVTVTTPTAGTIAASGICATTVPIGSFVFYSQYNSQWSGHAYGTGSISANGSGPVAAAMVIATLADKTVNPISAADYGTSIGAFISPEQGSDPQKILGDTPANWGLRSSSIGQDMNRAIEILKSGGLILATGTGAEPFRITGHTIVLRGISASGKILVADPAQQQATSSEYDPADILRSVTVMYGVTK